MASNTFGAQLQITTWGESHGTAMGVVIDGCPAGIVIDEAMIAEAMAMRAPGNSPFTSPRKEKDKAEILSGVFQGKTTGAPISIIIHNHDADGKPYEKNKRLLRPGHANFTYMQKYGEFDYRGGGRASARETACRVAAAAVVNPFIQQHGIKITSYIKQIGKTVIENQYGDDSAEPIKASPVFCPENEASEAMIKQLHEIKSQGDSIGGIVEFCLEGLPIGLGDPVYEKLDAKLAHAMLSIPGSKGFELGEGFSSACMKGSEHNDAFVKDEKAIKTSSNHAGGLLGGISNGMPVRGRVAFKPTASIKIKQDTLDIEGNSDHIAMSNASRHDPCIAIRAVPVVTAMCTLVVADALLMNRCVKV